MKELDEYVYNPLEAKKRLPQKPYQRLELILKTARDIIKKYSNGYIRTIRSNVVHFSHLGKAFIRTTTKNKIISIDSKQFVESHLIETAEVADQQDTSKHEQQIIIWTRERQEQLDDQGHRFVIEQKKEDLIEHLRLLEERGELLKVFENVLRVIMHLQDKAFTNENFEDIRAPGEHEYLN